MEKQRGTGRQDEQKFAELMDKLLKPATWSEKQQLELEMACEATTLRVIFKLAGLPADDAYPS